MATCLLKPHPLLPISAADAIATAKHGHIGVCELIEVPRMNDGSLHEDTMVSVVTFYKHIEERCVRVLFESGPRRKKANVGEGLYLMLGEGLQKKKQSDRQRPQASTFHSWGSLDICFPVSDENFSDVYSEPSITPKESNCKAGRFLIWIKGSFR